MFREKDERERRLERMTREQIIVEWKRATKQSETPTKKVWTMINEILMAEFPAKQLDSNS